MNAQTNTTKAAQEASIEDVRGAVSDLIEICREVEGALLYVYRHANDEELENLMLTVSRSLGVVAEKYDTPTFRTKHIEELTRAEREELYNQTRQAQQPAGNGNAR